MDLKQVATMLGGFGAGYSGQGGQYLAGLEAQKQGREAETQRQQMLSEERKAAMVQDAYGMLDLLNKGKVEAAVRLGNNRLESIKQLGGDPSDTQELMSMITSGDPAQFENAKKELGILVDTGIAQGYLKLPEEPKMTPYQAEKLKLDRERFEQDQINKGPQLDIDRARLDLDKAKLDFEMLKLKGQGGLDADTRQKINKDITPIVKSTEGIHSAASSLDALKNNTSAASQLAAVFKFMKALDPTSVVRETEQGMVYDAQGAAQGIAGRLNKLMGEGGLTKEGFADIVGTAKVLANAEVESKDSEIQRYLDVYEGTLPEGFVKAIKGRVPKKFEIESKKESTQKTGGQIMIDANGNRAMVYPDGSYEEL